MKVLLHAPTADAVRRARSNLRNLLAADSEAEVRIVANAGGVAAALDSPDSATDGYLYLCENTLHSLGLAAPAEIATVAAAVYEIARLQSDGWIYIRA